MRSLEDDEVDKIASLGRCKVCNKLNEAYR